MPASSAPRHSAGVETKVEVNGYTYELGIFVSPAGAKLSLCAQRGDGSHCCLQQVSDVSAVEPQGKAEKQKERQ
eukprot:SAG22_NODE_11288_length_492_cov_0.888041_2_plen_74_part_00